MKPFKPNREQGIIKYIVIVVAAIILIAYFRNDIMNILNSARFKDALLTAIGWIQTALVWIVNKLGWTSSQIK